MAPVYTKTGDAGETGLFGNARVPKNNARIEAYGCVDELNAGLGYLRSLLEKKITAYDAKLQRTQEDLFIIGALLATPPHTKLALPLLKTENIQTLEKEIDVWESALKKQTHFLLPTGTQAAAFTHLCRTYCRRAERKIVTLGQKTKINKNIIPYMNRLSDWLFILARMMNATYNKKEDEWIPIKKYAPKKTKADQTKK